MIDKYQVILLCAGKGERMCLPLNKIFYKVNNEKTIFDYSYSLFYNDDRCEKIIVVYNKDDKGILTNVLNKYDLHKTKLVVGGSLRQESVMNGLQEITGKYVLVHDAARPNIDNELVNNVLNGLVKYDNVSLGVKVTDTIKKYDGNVTNIDRNNLYYMQTPQGAKTEVLKKALNYVNKNNINVTDDLQAVEILNCYSIGIVEGRKTNIKVTTIDDIDLIKFYLEKKDV